MTFKLALLTEHTSPEGSARRFIPDFMREGYLEFAVYELNAENEIDPIEDPEGHRVVQIAYGSLINEKIVSQLLNCKSRTITSKTFHDKRTSEGIVIEAIMNNVGYNSREAMMRDIPSIFGYSKDKDWNPEVFSKGVFGISRKKGLLSFVLRYCSR